MTLEEAGTDCTTTYDALAHEYYDEVAHPTCCNLNALSRRLVASWLPMCLPDLDILEVGAGKSTVAPLLHSRQDSLKRLALHDQSEKMLEWSRDWAGLGATLRVADALNMARETNSVDLLVAGLGDPYNVPEFWGEASRVCRQGATLVFTMPSYEWAARFRLDSRTRHVAEFQVRGGKACFVPSFVYRLDEQIRMIEGAGWMLTGFESLGSDSLPSGQPLSPKADVFKNWVSSLVWGFRARRQAK